MISCPGIMSEPLPLIVVPATAGALVAYHPLFPGF
jgi:hypothetical protein